MPYDIKKQIWIRVYLVIHPMSVTVTSVNLILKKYSKSTGMVRGCYFATFDHGRAYLFSLTSVFQKQFLHFIIFFKYIIAGNLGIIFKSLIFTYINFLKYMFLCYLMSLQLSWALATISILKYGE